MNANWVFTTIGPPFGLCANAVIARWISPASRASTERTLCAGAHLNHTACSNSVAQADHSLDLGAMLATEECAFLFEPVTDDMNTTIVAGRGQRMDRALKAIKGVRRAIHAHLKRLVVVISAGFASGHDCLSFWLGNGARI